MAIVDDVLSGLAQLPDFLGATRGLVAEQQQTILALNARIAELVGQMRDAQEAARNELAATRANLQAALDAKENERAAALVLATAARNEAATAEAKMAAMTAHPDVQAKMKAEARRQLEALDAQRAELARQLDDPEKAEAVQTLAPANEEKK